MKKSGLFLVTGIAALSLSAGAMARGVTTNVETPTETVIIDGTPNATNATNAPQAQTGEAPLPTTTILVRPPVDAISGQVVPNTTAPKEKKSESLRDKVRSKLKDKAE